jgi:3-deoxy-D-manno-octulosonate cytidylyltransferase
MKVIGVIPARLAATRLPNKPLLDIAGKPMIQWVWERASQARTLHELYIATPDPEIVEAAHAFGAQAMLTSHAHRSGTDRMAEVARNTDGEIYVNIQGDEPLLNPEAIDRAVQPLLDDPSVMMSSLYCHAQPEDYEAPSVVKVVVDQNGDALYFSRSRIPYPREATDVPVLRHIGLYVFRKRCCCNTPSGNRRRWNAPSRWSSCACWNTATRFGWSTSRSRRLRWIRRPTCSACGRYSPARVRCRARC